MQRRSTLAVISRGLIIAAVSSFMGLITLAPTQGLAQAYPNKTIWLVVPFAPGGAVDRIGRVVAQKLTEQLGQPVLVENKPGASANLGAERVAQAAPDGYTLLLAANGLATNVSLFPNLTFNAETDFAPVIKIGSSPVVLVVPANSPYQSVGALIEAGRKDAKALSYASTGSGSSNHLAAEMLRSVTGIEALHVAYKGGAPALTDLMNGQVSFMLINPLEILSHVKSGRLRALAVAGTSRISQLPDVPTMAEAGIRNYSASVWWAVFAPAKTPADLVTRLNGEIRKALAADSVAQTLAELGVGLEPGSPADLAAFFRQEINLWGGIIKSAGIKPD